MESPPLEGQMKLGSEVAPAIVVCVLFFTAAVLSSANMMYTQWRFYLVLNAANLFRAVAYANRAAYLSHFQPSLEGVFLAFANAGYALNVAVLFLTQMMWCQSAVRPSMSARAQTAWKLLSALLVLPTVIFGLVIGVVGAGYQYGDLTTHGQSVGSRLRAIATWGLWGCTLVLTMSSGRLFLAALRIEPKVGHGNGDVSTSGDGHAPTSACAPSQHLRQQRLIGILCGVSLLLQVHALYNIVILYPQKMHLTSDKYWYPLSALPELLVLVPLTWPALLARVSLCWPRSSSTEGGDSGKGSDISRRGPNRRSAIDSGCNDNNAVDVV